MSRLIINNRTNVPMTDVLECVDTVIRLGRISRNNTQYCYLTSFDINGEEYHVVTDVRLRSDAFTFYKVPKSNQQV